MLWVHGTAWCTQHRTLACLSDVVDYFVAKVGPSARPLHVDMATLHTESISPASPPPTLSSGAATLGRTPPTRSASTKSSAFNQFVYTNQVVMTPSSLDSTGQSDTQSSSPPSPSDNRLNAAAAATGALTSTSSVSSSSEMHTAVVENVSTHSMNIAWFIVTVRLQLLTDCQPPDVSVGV